MRTGELLNWLEGSLPPVDIEEEALSDAPIDPKRVDLQAEYAKLNKKLFNDKLGMYPMKWNRRKGAGALVKWRWEGGVVKRRTNRTRGDRRKQISGGQIKIRSIEVSTYYQSTIIGFISRLAHEMIHVFLLEQDIDESHGRMFLTEMRRINAMNLGFKIVVSEDATNFTPSSSKGGKGSRRGVVVFDDKSIMIFGPKHFSDTFFEVISGFSTSWLEQHKFEWYWSDALSLMKFPAARKVGRRFRTYKVTQDEIKDVKKGEKIANIINGEPKSLKPKYFDGATITGTFNIGGRL